MPISMMLRLAWRSLLYRRGAVALTAFTIAVSVFTLLGIEHVRQATRQSFNSTVSGVDLIVGPRTSDLNLLLTTVFRIGNPSQNMSWRSYLELLEWDEVAWAIPISLGDSHKGFRVVGTEAQFFNQFRYGQARALTFAQGQAFSSPFEVVLGAKVAQQLNYLPGHSLVLSHGLAATSFQQHDTHPFSVAGILAPTSTPVDNALYVSLTGLEAIHAPAHASSGAAARDLQPSSISSAMLGLKSRLATFRVQRQINSKPGEPLTAILPGVALSQLWQISSGLENTLRVMTHLVLLASLLGLAAMLLATLRERSYEIMVLRSLGAGAGTLFLLIQIEALALVLAGMALAIPGLALAIALASDFVAVHYGIDLGLFSFNVDQLVTLGILLLATLFVAGIPAVVHFCRSRYPMARDSKML